MRARLLFLCSFGFGCGLMLGPSRPYRQCEKRYQEEHATEIAACNELRQKQEACMDAVPFISDTYPYRPEGAMEACAEKYPWRWDCAPEFPCNHLYDGMVI